MSSEWFKKLGATLAGSVLPIVVGGLTAKLQGQAIPWSVVGSAAGVTALTTFLAYINPSPTQTTVISNQNAHIEALRSQVKSVGEFPAPAPK